MRPFVNKPGVTFNPAKTTVVFAEDMLAIDNDIKNTRSLPQWRSLVGRWPEKSLESRIQTNYMIDVGTYLTAQCFDEHYWYLTCNTAPATIFKVDRLTIQVVASAVMPMGVGGFGCLCVAGPYLLAGDLGSNATIHRINKSDLSWIDQFTFSVTPSPITQIIADGYYAYAMCDPGANYLFGFDYNSPFETASNDCLGFVGNLKGICTDSKYLYGVTDNPYQAVVKISLPDLTLLTTADLSSYFDPPRAIFCDGHNLLVTGKNASASLVKLNPSDLSVSVVSPDNVSDHDVNFISTDGYYFYLSGYATDPKVFRVTVDTLVQVGYQEFSGTGGNLKALANDGLFMLGFFEDSIGTICKFILSNGNDTIS